MKILLMCDGPVGNSIAEWLLKHYPSDIGALVVLKELPAYTIARKNKTPYIIFESETQLQKDLCGLGPFDLGVLAWWPKILTHSMLKLTSGGFINTHPSLLPYNRGKNYNFWALVEESPFGVSLHYVDEGIDNGDIISQSKISYTWEDTGETLYSKASSAMVELFKETYPKIRSSTIPRVAQDRNKGSFHYAKEIDLASKIDLNKNYSARELINLLRARTFTGYPSCYFEDDGEAYEITVNIKRK